MAFNGRSSSSTGIVLALINACFIAGYTLVDGTGVRLSETALGYTLWTFFMNGFCLLSWAMIARRPQASRYLRQHWKKGMVGGIGTMGSYGLAPAVLPPGRFCCGCLNLDMATLVADFRLQNLPEIPR